MHPDPEQLKKNLLAYDPRRDEHPDPAIIADLQELNSNPDLKTWFEAERSFDRNFSESLSRIPVPPSLKNQILEAAQAIQNAPISSAQDSYQSKPQSFKAWWLNAGLIGGMVAAVLVAAVYFTFFVNPFAPRATPELQQFVQTVEHIACDRSSSSHVAQGYDNVASFLASQGTPEAKGLAAAFQEESDYACDLIDVDGKSVTVMCFQIGSDKYHVFTLNRSNMPDIQNIPRPIVSKTGRHACATWTDPQKIYVLATTAPQDTLLTALY